MKVADDEIREQVQLLRGGDVVSSLAGAFGTALRETRLTALLGYLIALEPICFLRRFGFFGKPLSVSLETSHATGRSDILIETTEGVGIVEAKVDATDPSKQARKYPAKWRVLVTQYTPPTTQRELLNMTYLRWVDLAVLFRELSASSKRNTRFVSNDLLTHLEEHNMIKKPEPVEIYAREINEPVSLSLFLKAHMYLCKYKSNTRLTEAVYFAPHFGQAIATEHPGIHTGISYLARIETIEVAETWGDFVKVVRLTRQKPWFKANKRFLEPLRDWFSNEWRLNCLFLSQPRLVFNPPVKKETLQPDAAWIRQYLTFDELFKAWGC
jgi:hypothetical protein